VKEREREKVRMRQRQDVKSKAEKKINKNFFKKDTSKHHLPTI
jgi:hypothetical protein